MVYYDANNLKDNFYNSTNLFLYVDNLNTSQINGINSGSNFSGGVIKDIGKVKSNVKKIGNLSNDVNYLKSKVEGQIKSKITGLVTLKLNDIDKIKPLLGFAVKLSSNFSIDDVLYNPSFNSSEFKVLSGNELQNVSIRKLINEKDSNGKRKYYKVFVITPAFFEHSNSTFSVNNKYKLNVSQAIALLNGAPVNEVINMTKVDKSLFNYMIFKMGGLHRVRTLLFSQMLFDEIQHKDFKKIIFETKDDKIGIYPETPVIFLIKNLPDYVLNKINFAVNLPTAS